MDPAGWRYVGKTGEVKGAGGAAGAIYDWFQDCKRDMPSWELYISIFDMFTIVRVFCFLFSNVIFRLGLKKTGGKFPAEVRQHFSANTVSWQ